jgi:hypothetical protein
MMVNGSSPRLSHVPIDFIDEGYTFLFLTTEEYARLQKNPCFTVKIDERSR